VNSNNNSNVVPAAAATGTAAAATAYGPRDAFFDDSNHNADDIDRAIGCGVTPPAAGASLQGAVAVAGLSTVSSAGFAGLVLERARFNSSTNSGQQQQQQQQIVAQAQQQQQVAILIADTMMILETSFAILRRRFVVGEDAAEKLRLLAAAQQLYARQLFADARAVADQLLMHIEPVWPDALASQGLGNAAVEALRDLCAELATLTPLQASQWDTVCVFYVVE
jgi:hypothetical protein